MDTATEAKYITALEVAKKLSIVLSVLLLWKSIVWQLWQHSLGQETKVSPEDQVIQCHLIEDE
jgi:hypothetical protein